MTTNNSNVTHTLCDKDMDNNLNIAQPSPYLNMKFDTEGHAYTWYNEYAKGIGFSVRREYVNKNKETGVITSRRFVCFKEGIRRKDKRDMLVKKPRKETRTGCEAHMTIGLQPNGKYTIIDFEPNHNHKLADQSCAHILPSQRQIAPAQAIEFELADDSGIRPKLAFELMGRRAGGRENLGYLQQDQKNYLRTKRKNALKYGEAGSLLNYFHNQLLENPSFFFKVQTDIEDQITNIFWADAKMVLDYGCFGDVLFFDTTYRTNKECRPFGAFVGLNHHYQQVVFGASLLYDETAASFEWLFETFLNCMSGKKPKTIYTDQDAAMAKAIPLVMPETYHRICLWHMYQNALKHLNPLFKGHKSFGSDFKKCIYDCEDEDEFFNAWEDLLNKYDLCGNDWLQGLLKIKEKWAMAYGRQYFSAGKKSTQLSESFNAHLRDYLKSDLDLVQFFKHFQRAVDDRRYNEVLANYDMSQKIPRLKVNVPLLQHARDVYTGTIFDMFQDEYEKSLLVIVDRCVQTEPIYEYKVSLCGHSRQQTINFTSIDGTISCSCKNFEFVGILCGHALKVLDDLKMKLMIPERYILKRWTKNARAGFVTDVHGREIQENPKLEVGARYNNLCNTYVKLVGKGAASREACDLLENNASELCAKLEEILMVQSPSETQLPSLTMCHRNGDDNAMAANVFEKQSNKQVKHLKKRVVVERGKSRHKSCIEKGKKKRSQSAQVPTSSGVIPTTCHPLIYQAPQVIFIYC
ncbi:hypothetical protein L1049_010955 [Liquidambar formosana]|uniref:SWIM-type domain-containing protein n=1 Tax=Liquidambar formosana TaxID=63359 RepID=A0AAP0RR03_LIQFO